MDILVIDSNSYDAELTARVIRGVLANPIRLAKDGPQAVAMLYHGANGFPQPYRPQLIFLDAHLLVADPLEILRQLRAEASTANTPVVLLASSEDEAESLRKQVPGRCAVTTKPLDLVRFAEVLMELEVFWVLLDDNPARVSKTVCVGAW